MLKKSDILPLILATISTAVIVGWNFFWITKMNTVRLNRENKVTDSGALNNQDVEASFHSQSLSPNSSISSREVFVIPAIVPQGTAVTINGSSKMDHINQALRKGFHRQFPGTAVITSADGNKQGIDLLTSGAIDVAAIDRPLSEAEQAIGLASMKITNLIGDYNNSNNSNLTPELYYAYKKPATAEVEAFLGYALSSQGQQAINQR